MTFSRRLSGSLLLRNVQTEADIEQYIAFNTIHNNPFEGAAGACLLRHHPETTLENFWVIEDEAIGQIVSTTCLIPWECQFQELKLKAAQLEMVLTHPAYRGKGLVRAQIERFHQVVSEHQFDLSIIWGIHYFYRQFGYAYALDGGISESLPVWRIPEHGEHSQDLCSLRRVTAADIPFLASQYTQSMQNFDFYVNRTERYWHYLLESALHPVEIIEVGKPHLPSGYIVIQRAATKAKVLESCLTNAGTALALLQALKLDQRQEISIAWPETAPLVQAARVLGSQTQPGGQWLLRIPDLVRLLKKMGVLFASRLEKAGWCRFTGRLTINLYHRAYELIFVSGRLSEACDLGFVNASMGSDGGDLCIPPEAFTRLVFGYRTLEELADAWPDISIRPEARPLIEVLFPTLAAHLYTPYHYLGPLEQVP